MNASSDGRGSRGAAAFVWSAWLLASIGVVAFTAHFASDMPVWDEDQYVPIVAGEQPFSFAWLFERHVDHLIPIPKALYLATVGTLRDFRSGAFASGILMSAAVALLLFAVRRMRGRWIAADAVFPLVALHWGRVGNLLGSEQIQYTASVVLQAAALAIMLSTDGVPSRRVTIAFAACLVALPFCGGQGLALVPALALWPLVVRGSAGEPRRDLLVAGAVPFLLAVTMIVSHRPAFPATAKPAEIASMSMQFLGQSAGPVGGFGWEGTRLAEHWPPLVAFGAAALAAIALVLTTRDMRTSSRAAGISLQLLAILTLAVVLGVGRGGDMERAGLQERYSTLAMPLLWLVHLAFDGFESRWLKCVILGAAIFVFVFGCWVGTLQGGDRHRRIGEAIAALRAGEAHDAVAARFSPLLHPDPAYLRREFATLERARLGPWRTEADR